jgi:hypothetical protein
MKFHNQEEADMFRNRFFNVAVGLGVMVAVAFTVRLALATPSAVSQPERAALAYAARWTGLAEAYADQQRSLEADAARWSGLAQMYEERHHWGAVGAYYTGQAITHYVRTGNPDYLPQCISAATLAMLPSIGDNTWRAEIAICG